MKTNIPIYRANKRTEDIVAEKGADNE